MSVRAWLEPLLLTRAIARARAVPEATRPRAGALGKAAFARRRAARALRTEEHDAAALSLEREAARLAISALVAARGETFEREPSASEVWARLPALPDAPAGLAEARTLLASDDPLAFDGLSLAEAARARARVAPVVDWLLAQAEPRTEHELRWLRVVRWAAVAGGVAAAVWLVLWLFVFPRNEAERKPVAQSTVRSGTANPDVLTDGERRGRISSTDRQTQPWVRVDLLNRVAIERVEVFGNVDTSVPLVLELSDDDQRFAEVAVQKEPLTKGHWRADLHGKRGRFLRLRHTGTGQLALSEIEVWVKRGGVIGPR